MARDDAYTLVECGCVCIGWDGNMLRVGGFISNDDLLFGDEKYARNSPSTICLI